MSGYFNRNIMVTSPNLVTLMFGGAATSAMWHLKPHHCIVDPQPCTSAGEKLGLQTCSRSPLVTRWATLRAPHFVEEQDTCDRFCGLPCLSCGSSAFHMGNKEVASLLPWQLRVALETASPGSLMLGKCLLPAPAPTPSHWGQVQGQDYSIASQVLSRKTSEKCGNCLQLVQSLIKFLSSVLSARPRTHQSQNPSPRFPSSTLPKTSYGLKFLPARKHKVATQPFMPWGGERTYTEHSPKPPVLRKTRPPRRVPLPYSPLPSPPPRQGAERNPLCPYVT